MEVSLREVGRANVRAICELRLADSQADLVAPAAFTVAEAGYESGSVLRAIYFDAIPVGVLLVETESGLPYLVRFMVDAGSQGRGIGRQAVALLAQLLAGQEWDRLETSFVPVAHGAEGFWRRCGFADTGRINDEGEPVWSLALTR